MKKKLKILRTSIIVAIALLCFMAQPTHTSAVENGGAVQTNGGISFYENKTIDSSIPDNPKTTPSDTTKPAGKLPSTGELVKRSLSISGAVIVVLAIFFYLWKRKKGKNEEGNRI